LVGSVFDEDVGGFAVAVAETLEAERGEQLGDLVGEIAAQGDIVGEVAVFNHGSEVLGVGDFFGDKNILLTQAFLEVIKGGQGPRGGQAAVDEHVGFVPLAEGAAVEEDLGQAAPALGTAGLFYHDG